MVEASARRCRHTRADGETARDVDDDDARDVDDNDDDVIFASRVARVDVLARDAVRSRARRRVPVPVVFSR